MKGEPQLTVLPALILGMVRAVSWLVSGSPVPAAVTVARKAGWLCRFRSTRGWRLSAVRTAVRARMEDRREAPCPPVPRSTFRHNQKNQPWAEGGSSGG